MKRKIFVSTATFAEFNRTLSKKLESLNFEIALNPYRRKLKSEELIKLAHEAIGLIAGTEEISASVLKKLPHLRVISRCGAGLDSIDSQEANRLGIKIFNTPDAPTVAVAELTVGLMLCLLRNISGMANEMKKLHWTRTMGKLLMKKRVGIIGLGRIGSKVAELLKPFGCIIAYSDPLVKNSGLGFTWFSKVDILGWADIITLHVPDKKCIIDKKELALMKSGSWLINTSRGAVVNESALYECLKNGHLSGAAIDVFEHEPYDGPLSKLDNIILTPHIGSYAKEARIEMERQAVDNLLKGLGEIK